jgi:hypothetical protein
MFERRSLVKFTAPLALSTLALSLLTVGTASAATAGTWSSRQIVGRLNQGNAQILTDSCYGVTFCASGGRVGTASDTTAPFVTVDNNGTWSSRRVAYHLKADETNGAVQGMSCTSATFCAAGGYVATATSQQPFLGTYNGTTWDFAVVGRELNTGRDGHIESVSCTSSTFCAAVGDYRTSDAKTYAFAEVYDGNAWTPYVVGHYRNTNGNAGLLSVSCAGNGTFCAAGGFVRNVDGPQAILSTFDGSTWHTSVIGKRLNGGNDSEATSVSCLANNYCAAAGYYSPSTGKLEPLVSTYNGETWSTQEIGGKANTGDNGRMSSVSCGTYGFCVAVGQVTQNGSRRAYAARYTGTAWTGQMVAARLNNGSDAGFNSVSCVQSSCAAVGYTSPVTSVSQALVSNYQEATWSSQTVAKHLNAGNTANLWTVSCQVSTACTAGGYFTDASGNQQALVSQYSVL